MLCAACNSSWQSVFNEIVKLNAINEATFFALSPRRTMNTLLLNELPQFNGLALQMIWSMLGTFSCLHKDLASDMEQLFQSFAQQAGWRIAMRVFSNVSRFDAHVVSFRLPAAAQFSRTQSVLGLGGICSAGRREEARDSVSKRGRHAQRPRHPGGCDAVLLKARQQKQTSETPDLRAGDWRWCVQGETCSTGQRLCVCTDVVPTIGGEIVLFHSPNVTILFRLHTIRISGADHQLVTLNKPITDHMREQYVLYILMFIECEQNNAFFANFCHAPNGILHIHVRKPPICIFMSLWCSCFKPCQYMRDSKVSTRRWRRWSDRWMKTLQPVSQIA